MFKKLLIFSVVLIFISAIDYETEDGIVILNNENFNETINSNEMVMVVFHAPWCGNSKYFFVQYLLAQKKLEKEGSKVMLAKIDKTENYEISVRYKVKGTPSIRFFNKGQAINYDGGRKEYEFVNWVRRKSIPPIFQVDDAKEEKMKESERILITFYGSQDSFEYKEFEKVASKNHSYTFLANPSNKLSQSPNVPTVSVFRQLDNSTVFYEKKAKEAGMVDKILDTVYVYLPFLNMTQYSGPELNFDESLLSDFLSVATVQRMVEFDDIYVDYIFHYSNPAIFLFVDKENETQIKLISEFSEAAEIGSDKLVYAFSDVKEDMQKRLAEFLGIGSEDLPLLMIVDFNGHTAIKYLYGSQLENLTTGEIDNYVSRYHNGELVKFFRSEEVPEIQSYPVLTIVGKNFHDIVGHQQDVLIMFNAPW